MDLLGEWLKAKKNGLVTTEMATVLMITEMLFQRFVGTAMKCLHCVIAGKNPSDPYLDKMMSEAPGPINFTMFLTMFGEKLNGTDPEDVIKNAFACFDENNTG